MIWDSVTIMQSMNPLSVLEPVGLPVSSVPPVPKFTEPSNPAGHQSCYVKTAAAAACEHYP